MSNLLRIFIGVKRSRALQIIIITSLLAAHFSAQSQDPLNRLRGGGGNKSGKADSLQHRNSTEDSITINYRFLDSSRLRKLDSSIYDFTKKVPLPGNYINLGNSGSAARSLVFTPAMISGWDPGWHTYDIYKFTVDESRFYNTTRPYTEIGYLIGSRSEQMINLVHTQNIMPNWNIAFQYRLINAPGSFQNQNTNHNNYRFTSWYQSKNKRYQAYLVMVGSKLQASENGGVVNPSNLDSNAYTERFNVPVQLGVNDYYTTNPFSTNITTGTFYSTGTFLLRQQYDIIGIKDSIVTDSTVIPLFYPKFRAEYNIQYSTHNFRFLDENPQMDYYTQHYNFISTPDTVLLRDHWKDLINDFSLYQFPDSKNPQQFLKAGFSIQNLKGDFDAGSESFYNIFLHGEYRNKTRNQKWDIEAFGKFYLNGYNSGDYNFSVSLEKTDCSKNLGYLQLGFQNVNRNPSFVFERESSFGFGVPGEFHKENTTNLFASIERPQSRFKITGSYYLISNYSYVHDYYIADQQSSLFNVLQVSLEKVFVLHQHWVWRAYVIFQQKAGASPVNVPAIFTRNQIGYEGKLGFRNLNLAFGAEVRYFTPYKADGYSPLVGQFFTQNQTTIAQSLPDINLYVQFRIRSFTAYVRGENLNTMEFSPNGFGFTRNNFVAPYYPYPGFQFKLGIFWGFVN